MYVKIVSMKYELIQFRKTYLPCCSYFIRVTHFVMRKYVFFTQVPMPFYVCLQGGIVEILLFWYHYKK
jgi:hypothetical protein